MHTCMQSSKLSQLKSHNILQMHEVWGMLLQHAHAVTFTHMHAVHTRKHVRILLHIRRVCAGNMYRRAQWCVLRLRARATTTFTTMASPSTWMDGAVMLEVTPTNAVTAMAAMKPLILPAHARRVRRARAWWKTLSVRAVSGAQRFGGSQARESCQASEEVINSTETFGLGNSLPGGVPRGGGRD